MIFSPPVLILLGKDLPPDAAEDSVSVLPALGEGKGPIREATIHQAPCGFGNPPGDWKLIALRNGTKELYNLKDDLGEKHNRINSRKAEAKQLEALLRKYITEGRSTPGPVQKTSSIFPGIRKGSLAKKREQKESQIKKIRR